MATKTVARRKNTQTKNTGARPALPKKRAISTVSDAGASDRIIRAARRRQAEFFAEFEARIPPERLRELNAAIVARCKIGEDDDGSRSWVARKFLTDLIKETLGVDDMRSIRSIDARAALHIAKNAAIPEAMRFVAPMPTEALSKALRSFSEMEFGDTLRYEQVHDALDILRNHLSHEVHPDAKRLEALLSATLRMLVRMWTIVDEARMSANFVHSTAERVRDMLASEFLTVRTQH